MANPLGKIRKIDMIINARSWQYGEGSIKHFNGVILRMVQNEENVMKELARVFAKNCFRTRFYRPQKGHKTYYFGGSYIDCNPLGDDLPF